MGEQGASRTGDGQSVFRPDHGGSLEERHGGNRFLAGREGQNVRELPEVLLQGSPDRATLAIMADAGNTGESATSYIRFIEIGEP